MRDTIKIFSILFSFVLFMASGANHYTHAQSTGGQLSFQPSSFSIGSGQDASVNVVWTGAAIGGISVVLNPPSGLQIVNFSSQYGTAVNDPTLNRADILMTPGQSIPSGSTILTITLRATGTTGTSGSLSFVQSGEPSVMVASPDGNTVSPISFGTANYTIGGSGGGGPITNTPSGLPKTAIINDTIDKVIFSLFTIVLGFGIFYSLKKIRNNFIPTEKILLINREE